jgi:HAD superfamily hydrolase (TIGR01509 family)
MEHIIFDLGNVLIYTHPEKAIAAFSEKCSIPASKIKTFYLSDLHYAFMEGRCKPEDFYSIIIKKMPCELTIEEFSYLWNKIIGKPKKQIKDLLGVLRKHFILSICSNTDPWHWEYIFQQMDFIRKFNYYFLSFQMKMNKPNPALFRFVLDSLAAKGEDCIFIDDSPENIETSEKFGIKGVLACETDQIINGLRRYHIELDL